jgi:2'-5' RNA ligase
MHALISTLDELNKERVYALWEVLASTCQMRHIYDIPLPHFSWHGAQSYSLRLLEPLLEDWAQQAEPFQVRTNGLGIFTGEKPIIYLRLVSTSILEHYHRQIWQHTQTTPSIDPSPHYAPHTWVPHITLGLEDVTYSNLGCAINRLAFQPYEWIIQVNNLMVVTHEPNQPGEIVKQFRLGNDHGS